MATGTIEVTDETFQQLVLKSDKPVLVDFWAEWCGPCKALGPVLEEVAHELADRVVVAKVNIDESPDAPARYRVRSIPSMLLFNKGEVLATKVGVLPKTTIKEWVIGYTV